MNAVPDKAEGDTSKGRNKPRRDEVDDAEMPPCDAYHVIEYLFEVGPTLGEGPITHAELQAWQKNTGVKLSSWEARVLRRLSVDYLGESHRAREIDCPAPWAAQMTDTARADVGKKVQDAFKLMIDTRPKK